MTGHEGTADDGGGPAPVVDCPSALYPLAVEWVPAAGHGWMTVGSRADSSTTWPIQPPRPTPPPWRRTGAPMRWSLSREHGRFPMWRPASAAGLPRN
ncbi:atp-Dependent helicase [Arthrobacter sp. Hiyo4]|nr:atp-Dependent helicase [Arthrobacter sp. Hiyo4]